MGQIFMDGASLVQPQVLVPVSVLHPETTKVRNYSGRFSIPLNPHQIPSVLTVVLGQRPMGSKFLLDQQISEKIFRVPGHDSDLLPGQQRS
jgi:hypothetical protein